VPATIQVTVTGTGGKLQGWIDWNADGDWWDASEQIITDLPVPAGTTPVTFSVPTWATNQTTYARFRISSSTGLGYAGPAQDGEVEDYEIRFEDLKWLQIPEQGQEGVDVNNTQFMLADDFVCTASGPITDIHLWGSFLGDVLPPQGPGALIFDVSIWSDVPANADAPYSHPGTLLWTQTFQPAQYGATRIWTVQPGEWWHDPGSGVWTAAADTNIFQFDFYPLPHESFLQVEGTIYWLAVKYRYEGPAGVQFGWKTTPQPWNDDACYFDTAFPPIHWKDLVYQSPHPWASNAVPSVNLAFALSGEERDVLDWGDAPDPTYPTLFTNSGASHVIVSNFMMGTLIDAEWDGQPAAWADGDDLNPPLLDDEDGVSFSVPLIRGSNVAVNVFLTSGSGSGVLDAWLDFDGSGVWGDMAAEQVFNGQSLSSGPNLLIMTIPANAALGTNYARFRLTSAGVAVPKGPAPDGEVEDYSLLICQRKLMTNVVITNILVTNLVGQQAVTLQWNAEAGISYQMQQALSLSNSPVAWTTLGPPILGPANTLITTNSTVPERYYRLWVPYVCP
jgi:hypothetical protein